MTILFVIVVILASIILGLIILVQNPKGGGLTGNVAGLGNQFMGVKQTNDVLEKGTWIFAAIIGALCLFSSFFMGGGSGGSTPLDRLNTSGAPVQQQTAPAPATQTAPATGTQTAPSQQANPTPPAQNP